MSNLIVGNIVLDMLDAAVVAHRHVVQRHMPQTGMFADASRQDELTLKDSQLHLTRETGMMHKFCRKTVRHANLLPIVGQTRLALQPKYLIFGQVSVILHDTVAKFLL